MLCVPFYFDGGCPVSQREFLKIFNLIMQGANGEGVPKHLTFDEIQRKTYMELKTTGTVNQCPTIDGGVDSFANAKKFQLVPTSFTVKAEDLS